MLCNTNSFSENVHIFPVVPPVILNKRPQLSLANKMVTREIREKFHARFVKILMILIRVEKTQKKSFSYFTIIPFDYFLYHGEQITITIVGH